eukprot:PhM_4_TR10802/c0_g2_i1/m.9392/K11540/CAD; carbamoyl-phosphate synthase / aspartate carbamoyltransferase / dihydroorotase
MSSKERCMFCFTGASHGTIVIKWLQELGYEVIVFIPDVGQARDLREMQRHCQDMGCVVIVDSLQDELVQNYLYPALQAKVELGISLSAPCIAKRQTELAKMHNCRVVSHGRRGDALLQYEMIFYSLDPNITVISPWTSRDFYSRFPSDEHILKYAEQNNLWVGGPKTMGMNTGDINLRHLAMGSGDVLQHITTTERVSEAETLSIEFREGLPVRVTNDKDQTTHTDPLIMYSYLNDVGRKHNIGVFDFFADPTIGQKKRHCFESPAHTILYTAHEDLENLTMDREVYKLRDMFVPEYNRLAKSGMWFSPEMSFLTSALRKSQERIDGVVMVQLYAGAVQPITRSSHASLYDRQLQSMAINDSLEPTDVEGYIHVHSLRLRAYTAIHTKHTPRAPSRWPAAKLVLADGSVYYGRAFGCPISVSGEVVFTTGMVGYPETVTDPSYSGQILCLTYPLIGNYGVPNLDRDAFGVSKHFESQNGKIHVTGLIVSEYCEEPSHWQQTLTLHEWLKSQNIPAVMMIDTRDLVKKLREQGSTLGKIVLNYDIPFSNPNERNLVAEVSVKEPRTYGHGDIKVLCIDMGVKMNTIRCFLKHNVTLKVVPHDWDITQEEYDGLFISNGPGDPMTCTKTIESVHWAQQQEKPIFGICMGNLMMGLACGAKTYKLKYGNRGQNQPCKCHVTNRVMITTQNHGYAIDTKTLPEDWAVYFTNCNDASNEGLRHKSKPFISVQFHPEARCGPQDTEYLFADFIENIQRYRIDQYIRTRPRKVLVLGAGGITIGQAGEFDYSGSQCCKSLKEEGIETVLINPNIATVQTTEGVADHVYFIPVTVPDVERVIVKEKPDGILLGFGGQTALNCGVALEKAGVLKRHGVRVLGTPVNAIEITEDRDLFSSTLLQINEHCAPSEAVTSIEDAMLAAKRIGYPVMVRCAFALGGLGSGICLNETELHDLVSKALANTPQALIEKSIKGWKEVEYEVVRDIKDNCITVCNMENFDPMGVHTGESIVVAPSQTLTNDEYHMLRTASIRIIRTLGIVGECNIQYGLDPHSQKYCVIEVNARLSRSSALASKATGYPLAHVAAKLALGMELSDVLNAVTGTTTACFEPSLDYCVVKIPRWDLTKFNMVSDKIGTVMKSVGEVMGIGRSFQEAIQKGLRQVDTSYAGVEPWDDPCEYDVEEEIRVPTPRRIFAIATALARGYTVQQIHDMCKVDKWFLEKLQDIIQLRTYIRATHENDLISIPRQVMAEAKAMGFSDKQIAKYTNADELEVRKHRKQLGVRPVVKQIDTVAGEFPAQCNYLYMSYNAQFDDIDFGEKIILILGCGVYRIGSSVEFDYSAVLAARSLRARGKRVAVLNYNPETVSTDYDESDRLYFDEISLERVLDIVDKECIEGIVISLGGQIAQNLAVPLQKAGAPIFGTSPDNIDIAEDRSQFSRLCDSIGVDQPPWASLSSMDDALRFCAKVGFPVLVRPSYVLSGSAMSVIWNQEDVDRYLRSATNVSGKYPVVISKYFQNAFEYDVDIVAHNGQIVVSAVSEHLEYAGVHSGDATMILPPVNADIETQNRMLEATSRLSKALCITGPMNVQYLHCEDGTLKVIEANVRASRSVPFVSKTLGISFPEAMAIAFTSEKQLAPVDKSHYNIRHYGVKAPMFSWIRLVGADPVLGVEMSSTGEVGVFGYRPEEVFLKALMCTTFRLPRKGIALAIDGEENNERFLPLARILAVQTNLALFALPETFQYLTTHGVNNVNLLYNPKESAFKPNYADAVQTDQFNLVIQLRIKTNDYLLRRLTAATGTNDYHIRRMAIDFGKSLLTEMRLAEWFVKSFVAVQHNDLEIEPYSAYLPKDRPRVAFE